MPIRLLLPKHVSAHAGQIRGSDRKKKLAREKREALAKRATESGKSAIELRQEDQASVDAIRRAPFAQLMKSTSQGSVRSYWR